MDEELDFEERLRLEEEDRAASEAMQASHAAKRWPLVSAGVRASERLRYDPAPVWHQRRKRKPQHSHTNTADR